MNSDIKSFTISGGSEVFNKGRRGISRRKKDKLEGCNPGQVTVKKHGGGVANVMTAGVVPLSTQTVISGPAAPSLGVSGRAPTQGAPIIHGGQQQSQSQQQQQQQSQSQQSQSQQSQQQSQSHARKVELRKSTIQHKVLLNPKKYKVDSTPTLKSRKTRKISIGMKSLHNRITRAKKIREEVKELPLPDLRKELINRGLIKESSKAPESILRQIAADAQIVAGKGL